MISDDIKKREAHKKSLIEQMGGERWVGTYDFQEDYCVNFLRLMPSPGITEHLFEIIDDAYYGEQNDFDWGDLAPNPPESIPGTDCTEENDSDFGITDVFFATDVEPSLDWAQRISHKYKNIDVIMDYSWDSHELLGRVWLRSGRIYKQAHLTHFPAVDIIVSLDQGNNSVGKSLFTVVSD